MASDVLIDGTPEWGGSAFSVTEDATPVSFARMDGGFGSFTAAVPERITTMGMWGKAAEIRDTERGSTTGTITALGSDDSGNVTITADSRLSALDVTRALPPYQGTLGGQITAILTACSLTSEIWIDSTIAARPVIVAGWEGNAWDTVKELCVAQGIEMALVSNRVVFRHLRLREATLHRDMQRVWGVATGNLASSVAAFWDDREWVERGLAYPVGGWHEDVDVIQVDAGETLEVELLMEPEGDDDTGFGFSAVSVEQPVCVERVDREHASSSVYSVSGNDGLPIKPAQWAEGGGSVTVEVVGDGSTLKLTVVGPSEEEFAPYSLSMASGTSDSYSSLRLVGRGVSFERHLMELATEVSLDRATREVGVTIPGRFFASRAEARRALIRAAQDFSRPDSTIQFRSRGIHRVGEINSYQFPTAAEWNAHYAGMTVGQFNTQYAGETAAGWDAVWQLVRLDDFENQAFGNVAGARIFREETSSWYRVVSATTDPAQVGGAAASDNMVSDHNAAWAGMTVGGWNAFWAGRTVMDRNVRPMLVP